MNPTSNFLRAASRLTCRGALPLFGLATAWFLAVSPLQAGLREPDNVLFGTIVLDAQAVTADNSDVVVEARRHSDASVVASYAMGSNPAASNYYALRIVVESSAPLTSPIASLAGDSLDVVVRDSSGDRDSKPYIVASRGAVSELDFGSLDSDGNGLPDAWELQYFGRIGVNPNSTPSGDGMTVLQKFQLGIDPTKANAPHPADISPFDYSITINEISAYGLAWKTGKPWTLAPTNIPVEFVTRAGTLWRGGERYTLSQAASTNAPTWWVNITDGASGSTSPGAVRHTAKSLDPNSDTGMVVRTLPDGFQPGIPMTVKLETTLANDVTAYAIEEHVLPGWVVQGTTENGSYLPDSLVIRWGPFFDNQPRTFTYAVTPPTDATFGTFAGVGSFDGANVDTTGDTELSRSGVAMRLKGDFDPQIGIRLSMQGHPGARYAIDASSDLQSWSELVQVNPDSSGHIGIKDPDALTVGSRYYRARLVTP